MTTAPTIDPKRIKTLRKVIPATGSHQAPPNGTPVGCEVELLSWAAGMPWSDSTPCISPVIAALLRNWNDNLDEPGRARLHAWCLDHIEAITSTGGDGKDEDRAWLATDWLVRVCAPAWLDLAEPSRRSRRRARRRRSRRSSSSTITLLDAMVSA